MNSSHPGTLFPNYNSDEYIKQLKLRAYYPRGGTTHLFKQPAEFGLLKIDIIFPEGLYSYREFVNAPGVVTVIWKIPFLGCANIHEIFNGNKKIYKSITELVFQYSGDKPDALIIFNSIYHVLGVNKNNYYEEFLNSKKIFSKFYQN